VLILMGQHSLLMMKTIHIALLVTTIGFCFPPLSQAQRIEDDLSTHVRLMV